MTRKRVNPMRLTPACSSSMLRRMRMGMRRRVIFFLIFADLERKFLRRT